MGHKAKTKSKPTPPVKSTEKGKTTQQIKPSPTAKKNQTAEAIQKTHATPKVDNGTPPCSTATPFTQASESSVVSESRQGTMIQTIQKQDTTTSFFVFHKREHKKDSADVIGRRGLRAWKSSPGRNKSWANCKRHKLAHNDLEHLRRSHLPSNAFGWRFSTILTPSSLVRGQGMFVTKQSAPKTKRVSTVRHFQDLSSEYSPAWVLPGELPYQKLEPRPETKYRGGVNFLRLILGRETVGITTETFLERVSFPTTRSKTLDKKPHTRFTKYEDLVVIDLLRNESHADVYLVQDLNNLSKFYHAHAFLNQNHGLTGNWHTFSKRKMDRLRKSNGFYAETVQQGRKIIVMAADSEDHKNLHIKNVKQEFPPLPRTEGKASKIRLPRAMQLSYAAALLSQQSVKHPVDSNHRAHKAWEDRNGRTKKPADTIVIVSKPVLSEDPVSSQPENVWHFTPVVNGRKFRNIPLRNRFSILSKAIL